MKLPYLAGLLLIALLVGAVGAQTFNFEGTTSTGQYSGTMVVNDDGSRGLSLAGVSGGTLSPPVYSAPLGEPESETDSLTGMDYRRHGRRRICRLLGRRRFRGPGMDGNRPRRESGNGQPGRWIDRHLPMDTDPQRRICRPGGLFGTCGISDLSRTQRICRCCQRVSLREGRPLSYPGEFIRFDVPSPGSRGGNRCGCA